MDELYHHGTKGQKWGVRRYQNPDGSLTPEGRIRYGYDKSGVSKNTQERMKTGAKIGAGIGAATGLGVSTVSLGMLGASAAAMGAVLSPVAAVAVGATYVATYAASGAVKGTLIGGIYGAAETSQARKFMKNNPNTKTKMSDLKSKK